MPASDWDPQPPDTASQIHPQTPPPTRPAHCSTHTANTNPESTATPKDRIFQSYPAPYIDKPSPHPSHLAPALASPPAAIYQTRN